MYYLSACAIVKNETNYLEEWLNYGRSVGIEHFYIYDNESDIPVSETLVKYIAAGIATVIPYKGRGRQMESYLDCIKSFGHTTRFLAIIDADEFIIPKTKDTIPEILVNYESFGGLAVNWIIFGANGHKTKPDGLLIENYTMSSAKNMKHNNHIKSIVQPRYVDSLRALNDPHHAHYKSGYYAVSERYVPVPQAWADNTTEIIQINHYFTKSYDEFVIKCGRGRADVADPTIPGRRLEEFEEFNNECNIKDESALRFVEKTKSLYL